MFYFIKATAAVNIAIKLNTNHFSRAKSSPSCWPYIKPEVVVNGAEIKFLFFIDFSDLATTSDLKLSIE